MQALFKEVHTVFKSMNKYSKIILKFGMPLVFSVYICALFTFFTAGSIGAYDTMIRLTSELLLCGKELLGVIVIPSLILQILYLAEAFDNN